MLAVPAWSTTRYVAQTAGTFSGGTACNGQTAITPATFNGLTLAAGDITYVCGTITVAQNTTGLQLNNSGTSGNPIQIIFDSGAVMKSPEWPADGTSGAIDLGGNSYITINGQGTSTGGGGIIEATLNGDPGATCLGGTCTLHGDSNGIEGGTNSTNITVEGLSIIDMYVATQPNPGGGTCMYEHGNISGWVIQNNFMHDAGWCISLQYDSGPSNGVTIANNQIYNIDHGIALGGPSASQTLENVNVYGNYIHDYSNWDTPSDTWHHDGIHIWGDGDSGTDLIQNVNIYNNKFGGCIGTNVTAHIFIEQNGGNTKNVVGYNNTLIDTCNGADNDGLITTGVDGGSKWYNNTLICEGSSNTDVGMGTSSSPSVTWINNVVSGCGQGLMYLNGGSVISGGLHNNIYAAGPSNCAAGGDDCWNYASNSWQGTFSVWQSQTGQDASPSEYASSGAGLNSSGVPQSGSATINNGANLTSLGITALNSDITGATRPSTGAWTIGAYNYSSSTTYTLSTATAGSGTGTVSCTPSGSGISSGASYSCTVTPSTGSILASVSGCGGSGTTTYTGSMPASNCTVTATFNLPPTAPALLPAAVL
jgi:hypothetical protein